MAFRRRVKKNRPQAKAPRQVRRHRPEVEALEERTLPSVMLVKDIDTIGNLGAYGYPNPTEVGGIIFFTANDNINGRELWRTDGTEAGTTLVKDINPGLYGSYPYFLPSMGGTLFFLAIDPTSGLELWRSDGTDAGTMLVKDIRPGVYSAFYSPNRSFVELNGNLFFAADDGVAGVELWKTDGTELGTMLVKDINPIDAFGYNYSSYPTGLQRVGNRLLFAALEPISGTELWQTDGTEVGTTIVLDINPGFYSGLNVNLYYGGGFEAVELNGNLFFAANDGVNGLELWKSDGTDLGTTLVKDINPGIHPLYGYPNNSFPTNFRVVDGVLFFAAIEATTGLELWRSEGTDADTMIVKDIRPGLYSGLGNYYSPPPFFSANGILFFRADDGTTGLELWSSDGTDAGTSLIKDIRPPDAYGYNYSSFPRSFVEVNGVVFFIAFEDSTGTELWRSDGTDAGTALVKDINPGFYSGFYYGASFANVNGTLFFAANGGTIGSELWMSDGTEVGTVLAADLRPALYESSFPYGFASINGTLFFVADSEAAGFELFRADPGFLSFDPDVYNVTEEGISVEITVTRSGFAGGVVTADFTTSDGSATAGEDYETASGQLLWADGELGPKTFTVNILTDSMTDLDETVNLFLSNITGGAIIANPAAAVITIEDVPAPGTIQFSAATYNATENGGMVTITVDRINGTGGPVEVDFATSDGTATDGADYELAAGTLMFADGQASNTFTIMLLDDMLVEGAETINLALANPSGGAVLGDPILAIVNVADLEAGVLQLSAATFNAVENTPSVTITVVRVNGSDGPVGVSFLTSDGSALAGADYTLGAGMVNFADGETSAMFTVNLLDDRLIEGPETFNVTLSNPTAGATLGSPITAVVNLADFEEGELQFSAATINAVENGGTVLITVNRVNGSDGIVSVSFMTSDGSAMAGADYTMASNSLTFGAGETNRTFSVTLLDDTLVEGAETFNVVLNTPTGGAILGTPATAVVNLADFEEGALQLSAATYNAVENGGTVLITVNRVSGSDGAVSVSFGTGSGSALAGADFTAAAGMLNFAAGQTSQTFMVTLMDDILVEGLETFNVTLSTPTGGARLGTPTTGIVNLGDFEEGALQFSAATANGVENGGSVMLTVNRISGVDGAIGVSFATSDGTAVAGADYTGAAGMLMFAPGETSMTITINLLDDRVIEGAEAFNVTLNTPTGGARLGTPVATAVMMADVEEGQFQFNAAAFNGVENGAPVTITVTRTNGTDGAVSVGFATSDGTATTGADFVAATGQLNWAAGETGSKTFTVNLLDDRLVEGAETINLTLSNPTGNAIIGALGTAVGNLADFEEGTLQFSAATFNGAENGGTVTITVTRTSGMDGPVAVTFGSTSGTATAAADFTAAAGQLNWADGESGPKTFAVNLLDDQLVEGAETINLSVSSPTGNAILGTPTTAVVNLADFEEGQLEFAAPVVTGTEGQQAVMLVNRVNGSDGTVTVDFASSDGKARAGADYTAAAGTLTFAAGELSKAIPMQMLEDTRSEGREHMILTLSNPTGGGRLGPLSVANMVVLPSDPLPTNTFADQDNDAVAVKLAGGGQVQIFLEDPDSDGKGPIAELALINTTAASALTVSAKKSKTGGNSSVDIGGVNGASLKSLSAKASDVVETGINLTGFLGSLTVRDIRNGADIVAGGNAVQKTKLTARSISDGTTIDIDSAISSLIAARFGAGAIVAPSMATLQIKGDVKTATPGNFAADVTLSGQGVAAGKNTLNSVRIAGVVTGSMMIITNGSVGAFQAGGFVDSALFVGFVPTDPLNPMAGGAFTAGLKVNSFKVLGGTDAFANSYVVAATVGAVSLRSADVTNGGQKFGILADVSITGVSITTPPFKSTPGQAVQGVQDFEVRIV